MEVAIADVDHYFTNFQLVLNPS